MDLRTYRIVDAGPILENLRARVTEAKAEHAEEARRTPPGVIGLTDAAIAQIENWPSATRALGVARGFCGSRMR